jgi:YaiO family outer membrane protein
MFDLPPLPPAAPPGFSAAPAAPVVVAQARGTDLDAANAAVKANDLVRAEQLVQAWLQAHPEDQEGRFLAGRLASWRGDHGRAIHYLATLVFDYVGNADYQAALGRAHFYNGDREAALIHLDRARALATSDFEVWALEIKLLEELGGPNTAVAQGLRVQMAKRFPGRTLPAAVPPLNAKDPAMKAFLPAAPFIPNGWSAELGGEYEQLTRGLPAWYGASVQVVRTWSPRQRLWARLRETSRFDMLDTEAALGGTWPLRGPFTGTLELSGSPTSNVLPAFAATAIGGVSLDPWAAEARVRMAAYRLTFVPALTLAAERYLGPFRAGYGLTVTRAPDASFPLVHTGSLSWYPNDDHALTVGLAAGEEVEQVAPLKVARTPTLGAYVTGRLGLPGGWALLPELGYTDQAAFFARTRARLMVEKKF